MVVTEKNRKEFLLLSRHPSHHCGLHLLGVVGELFVLLLEEVGEFEVENVVGKWEMDVAWTISGGG